MTKYFVLYFFDPHVRANSLIRTFTYKKYYRKFSVLLLKRRCVHIMTMYKKHFAAEVFSLF